MDPDGTYYVNVNEIPWILQMVETRRADGTPATRARLAAERRRREHAGHTDDRRRRQGGVAPARDEAPEAVLWFLGRDEESVIHGKERALDRRVPVDVEHEAPHLGGRLRRGPDHLGHLDSRVRRAFVETREEAVDRVGLR